MRRYGLMLACMGLGALAANGATGPLACSELDHVPYPQNPEKRTRTGTA